MIYRMWNNLPHSTHLAYPMTGGWHTMSWRFKTLARRIPRAGLTCSDDEEMSSEGETVEEASDEEEMVEDRGGDGGGGDGRGSDADVDGAGADSDGDDDITLFDSLLGGVEAIVPQTGEDTSWRDAPGWGITRLEDARDAPS